jgi:hypothetical protein
MTFSRSIALPFQWKCDCLIDDHEYCESEICVYRYCLPNTNSSDPPSDLQQDRFIFMPTLMFLGKFYIIYLIYNIIIFILSLSTKGMLKDLHSLSRPYLSRGKRMNESESQKRFEKMSFFPKCGLQHFESAGCLFFMSHRSLIRAFAPSFLVHFALQVPRTLSLNLYRC